MREHEMTLLTLLLINTALFLFLLVFLLLIFAFIRSGDSGHYRQRVKSDIHKIKRQIEDDA